MANQEIGLTADKIKKLDGDRTSKYPNVRRQVRNRLEEIDDQIARLEAKKKTLLGE